jgi:colanic acid biosynthesis glycosyl transferase WcaI
MKILIQGVNFHPEIIGIGKYTSELAQYLSSHGHQIRVVTAPPYYPQWKVNRNYTAWRYGKEYWQGIEIYRCPLWVPRKPSGLKRIIHLTSFAFSTLPVMLSQVYWGPDLIFNVAPAISSAINALLLANFTKGKSWLHVQDFELDTAIQLGMMPGVTILKESAQRIENWIYQRYDVVSTISECMLERLLQKGVPPQRARLFLNWVDTHKIYPLKTISPLRKKLGIEMEKIVVLYSGNIGYKQGLEVIVEVARKFISDSRVLFVISGEGAAKFHLKKLADGLVNMLFLPLQPADQLNGLLNLADIHLLPQRADAADLVMPSKLTGMLASGRPVIATANNGTQIAQVVEKVGYLIPPEDPIALEEAIGVLTRDKNLREQLGKRGRLYVEKTWARESILGEFLDELSTVVGS